MAEPFDMTLAGLTVHVEPLHERIGRQCRGYRVDAAEGTARDMTVRVTPAMIDRERRLNPSGAWSDDYLETLAVHRAVAERLPAFGRLAFHGAAIAYAPAGVPPRGLVFTAPSGTGKSTHIALWRRRFGDAVQVVNGDKPILAVGGGDVTVHATPWAGKEGWQTPKAHAPLVAMAVVTRGDVDRCDRLDPAEATPLVLRQTYMPATAAMAEATLDLADRLLATVPVYRLTCGIRRTAVDAAATAMLGVCPGH